MGRWGTPIGIGVAGVAAVGMLVSMTYASTPPAKAACDGVTELANDPELANDSLLWNTAQNNPPLRGGPKLPKPTLAHWRPSKRRGAHKVVTTLVNIHSRESVPVLKRRTPPDDVIDGLFRCRGFGDTHPVDPKLLSAIIAAADRFEAPRVDIISAYRSPKFNDALAKKGRRVAAESKHTQGRAIDFSLSSATAREVGAWLWAHFEGGVGVYKRDNFVHIDTGNKRRWQGR
ncbi:MAG: DUF882 domain-containing protein [Myxococcota bacterium]|nr:DUF882 domain-containing protein [Myxococcota bacterium]